jgi:hypothetical protein
MTPPGDTDDDGTVPSEATVPAPLAGLDPGRHVANLTGMTPESAQAFVSFTSGLRAAWSRPRI